MTQPIDGYLFTQQVLDSLKQHERDLSAAVAANGTALGATPIVGTGAAIGVFNPSTIFAPRQQPSIFVMLRPKFLPFHRMFHPKIPLCQLVSSRALPHRPKTNGRTSVLITQEWL